VEVEGAQGEVKAAEAALAKAHTRDSLQAIEKLTAVVDGKRQIMRIRRWSSAVRT
jgi:hypothetical protein